MTVLMLAIEPTGDRRYRADRPRKLTLEQEGEAQQSPASLRSLAADMGVSHETVRTARKRR